MCAPLGTGDGWDWSTNRESSRTYPEEVDANRPLREFGFDSLGAVGLRNRLARATGRNLPAGLVYDHDPGQGVALPRRGTPTSARYLAVAVKLRRWGEVPGKGAGAVSAFTD
ncbi:acyl carrier protein [Saccharothrix xinjiangensis]|uniref:Phosphopantetheine-binding protein n=1 Tax=Saccharothrix xinjiangensis TaxID=204798 RepID=A0ABV9Y458_9PSEU